MNAILRKSLTDVTRRKGRTLLVALGIFIGVLGLTVINFTEDALVNAFTVGTGIYSTKPDIVSQSIGSILHCCQPSPQHPMSLRCSTRPAIVRRGRSPRRKSLSRSILSVIPICGTSHLVVSN